MLLSARCLKQAWCGHTVHAVASGVGGSAMGQPDLQGLCYCFTRAAPACCERCRPHKLFAAAQVLLLFAIILRFVEELRSAVHSKTLATPIISHSQVLSRQRITAARLLLGVLTSMHYVLPLCSVGKWRSGLIFASCLISRRPETWISQAVPWARAGPCAQAFCRLCCWCQVHTWDMFCFMPAQPCCSCHAALTKVWSTSWATLRRGGGTLT